MEKAQRKESFTIIIELMLRNENKEAFDKLSYMCGVDTGLFIVADYDYFVKTSASSYDIGAQND